MVANNLLEIYTLIFAWNMYEAIWDVLVGTGLALIPFVAAVVSNFRDNYESGDAKSAVKSLEITIGFMIIIMMLCVIPYRGFTTTLATVNYDLTVPDCNPPANTTGSGNNTNTGYDDAFNNMIGLDVNRPVMWSWVSFLSSALTHSTIESMSCVNNYEFMLMRISQVSIQDPVLRERIRSFHEVCFKKATERFNINPITLPVNISEVDDIDWIGSRVLLNAVGEYYRHDESYMQNMEQYGFNRQTTFRDSDNASLQGAHPYCDEVWSGESGIAVANPAPGLRELILNDIPVDDAGDILDDWMNWGSQVITVGVANAQTREDLIIKMILQAQAANLQTQTNVNMSNDMETDKSIWRSLTDSMIQAGSWMSTVDEFLQTNAMKQMVKVAGPMILALIQLVIIIASPFVMVLGNYKLSAFLSIVLTYFSFEFINVIWATAFWFDQRVLDIYMSSAGWIDIATNGFLVSAVSAGGIILLPMIWLGVMGYAGTGMVRSVGGIGGVGGGTAAGSNAFGSGSAKRGASYAASKIPKKSK